MNADLMGASGADAHFKQCVFGEAAEHFPLRGGMASGAEFAGHAGTANGIASDGFVDGAGIGFHHAVDQREIDFLDGAGLKLLRQVAVRGIGAGNDEDAASFFIQAVDDAWAQVTAFGGERAEAMEERVDEGAAVIPRPGVHDHAGAFVDADDGGIFEEHFNGEILGFGAERRKVGGSDVDLFATP